MKLFFIITILSALSFSLIIGIDLIMGEAPNGVIVKALNPFRVMLPAEYLILFIFILFFLVDVFREFLNKKKGDNSNSN